MGQCGAMVILVVLLLALLSPYSARAQEARSAAEDYRIEVSIRYWLPAADVVASSDVPDVPGTRIDFKGDLGLTDQSFADFQVVLHPARRHKFRLEYIPIRFDQVGSPRRDLIFNGAIYRAQLPITSRFDWKTYRFGYEYDVIARRRGFVGVIAEVKHTIVDAQLQSAAAHEVSHQAMPVPALGGIARFYPTARLSVTGETTYFAVPDRPDGHYGGSILDIDAYATWNFSRRLGAQGGFRDIDIHHLGEWNTAEFTLKGAHVGVVVRF
jgi:hypothetical protein